MVFAEDDACISHVVRITALVIGVSGSIITLLAAPAYPLTELGFMTLAVPIDYSERCEVKLIAGAEGEFMN